MIVKRPAQERGQIDHGWLYARHSFSFGRYYDPNHMGFRCLRVINEDTVQPKTGFPPHSHDNMEIITYVLEGAVEHEDSLGHKEQIRAGQIQTMSAGTGIRHSEKNPDLEKPLHLLQIWIEPIEKGHSPEYQKTDLEKLGNKKDWLLIAAPEQTPGVAKIHQDARLWVRRFNQGESFSFGLDEKRYAWIQVTRGQLLLNEQVLTAGDGAAVYQESQLQFEGKGPLNEVLLFDLP